MHTLSSELPPTRREKCLSQMLDLPIKITPYSALFTLPQKLNQHALFYIAIITAAENVAEKREFTGSCAFCSAVKWS